MSLHSCHGAHAYDDCQSRVDALDSESFGFQFGKLLIATFKYLFLNNISYQYKI